MVAGFLNPKDIAHTTTTRPARVAGAVNQRRWFANTMGTEVADQDLNDIIAAIRYAADYYSITDTEGDDSILQKAINAGATALTGNLLRFQNLVGAADKVPYFTSTSAMSMFTASLFSRNIMASSNSAQWRDALGISAAISDNVTAFGALASSADTIGYFTGPGTMALISFTAFGRSVASAADAAATRLLLGFGSAVPSAYFLTLIDDADAATARATLGLAAVASSASATDLTTGTLAAARLPVALSSIYGLTPAADRLPYYSGVSTAALATFTAFARTVLDDPDAATVKTTLGLATVATSASATDLSTGTLAAARLPASLSTIYGLTPATDQLPYYSGAGTAALAAFTAFGRSLVAAASAAAAGIVLGLAAIATSGSASDLITGTVPSATLPASLSAVYSLTPSADKFVYYTSGSAAALGTITTYGRSLVDDADALTARGTLGLVAVASTGSASDLSSGTLAAARLPASLSSIYTLTPAADQLPYYTGASAAAVTTLTSYIRTLLDDANAAAAQTTLGLVIGTNVQAQDAELSAIAGLVSAADQVPYFTGLGTAALMTVTAAARTVLDDTTVGAMATTLGLGTGSSPTFAGLTVLGATNAFINIEAAASGNSASIFLRTGASARWGLIKTATAEGGANAGSDLNINTYDDTGALLATPISIARATGNITLAVDLAVTEGGTGASTAAAARTNLGVAIGANVQAWSAKLDSLAAQTWAADQITYQTSASALATTPLTSFARTLIDDTTAAAARTTLGLVIGTDVQAQDAELAAIAGLVSAADQSIYFTGSGTASLMTVSSAARTLLAGADLAAMQSYLGIGTASSGVFAGLDITATGATAALRINADAGQISQLVLRTGTAARWGFIKTATAEGGANAGSDLQIAAYNDAGTLLNNPISIARATGALTLAVDLAITEGGTGASTASVARTNLGLAIGTDVQAFDAELTALAGLTSAADRLPYFTGAGAAALAVFTSFARTLVAGATAAAMQTTLGLVPGTDVQAQSAALTAVATQVSGATAGWLVTTASNTVALRTLTGTANRVTVTNGNGTVGNPIFDIGTDVVTLIGAQTLTNKVFDASANTLSNLTTAMFAANVVDNDTTLAANSATRLSTQLAVKSYVDNLITGLAWKPAVRVATTGPGTLATSFANGSVVDGVTLATGNRILIKDQASGVENGLYTINASGAPTRALDMNSNAEIPNATVFVEEGTVNHDTQWTSTNDATVNLGVTAITFAQVSGAGTYSAGFGLTLTGNSFAITDPELVALAGLVSAADQAPYFTGSGTAGLMTVTTAARTILDDTSVANIATTLGLGTGNLPTWGGAFLSQNGNAAATQLIMQGDAGQVKQIVLRTGTTPRWALISSAVAEGGSDTGSNFSISAYNDAGTFLFSPIVIARATGIITLSHDLDITEGGTGASTASAARTNLGVAIGADVQAWSAKLDSLAAQTWAADTITYQTSASALATTPLTSFARTFLDDTTAAAVRTTIGAVNIAGDTMTGGLNQTVTGGGALSSALSGEGVVQFLMSRYSPDNAEPFFYGRKARGTAAAPGDINQNDLLFLMDVQGYAGGAFRNAAYLYFQGIAPTPSSTDMQGKFILALSAAGSIAPTNILTADWTNGLVLGIDLDITEGGTGASTASAARTNLGLAIGTNVQAYDAGLQALSGLAPAADRLPYFTSTTTSTWTTLSSFARTFIDDANAAAVQTTLGLVPGTNVQGWDAGLQAISGLTPAADTVAYFTGVSTAALMTMTAAARTVLDDVSTAAMLTTLGAVPLAGGTMTGALTQQITGGGGLSSFIRGEGAVSLFLDRYSTDVSCAIYLGRKARGTISAPAAVVQNDLLFEIAAQGYDGAAMRNAGAIFFSTMAATPSATDMQGKFFLQLSAVGSVVPTNIITADWTSGIVLGIDLAVTEGGTGASTASAARTNLGLAIGTNVQAWSAKLDSLAAQTWAADTISYQTSTSALSTTALTSLARTLIGNTTTGAMQTTLGLAIGTNVQAWDTDLDALAGLTYAADLVPYFTAVHTAATMTVTAAARTILDDTTVGAMATTLGLAIGTNVQAWDTDLDALAGLTYGADLVPYFTAAHAAATMTVTAAARTVLDDTTTAAMLTTLGAVPLAGGVTTGALSQVVTGATLLQPVIRGESIVSLLLDRNSADIASPTIISRKSRGTNAALADVATGDFLLSVSGQGYAASGYRAAGGIIISVLAATPSATDMQSRFFLQLNAAGSVAPTNLITADWNNGLILGVDLAITEGGTGASTAAAARTNLGIGTGDTPTFAGLVLTAALPIAQGGTGSTTAATARTALGLGTASVVAFDTLTLTTALAVSSGGTGSSSAAGARTNLGLGTGDSPTFAGLTVTGAGNNTVSISSAASGNFAQVVLKTGSSLRWAMTKTSTAEGGANAGSDFSIAGYDDAGALINTPITITRSTGNIVLAVDLAITEGGTGASTAAAARTNLGVGTGDTPTFAGLVLTAALPVAQGGTGATTASAAATALGLGTGNTPTFAGLVLTAKLPIAQGGTGSSTAATARTALGLAIGGTDASPTVEAWSDHLDKLSGQTWAADQISYQTSATTVSTTPLTSFARTFLDDTTAAAVLTTIGAVNIAGDTMTGALIQQVTGVTVLTSQIRGEASTQLQLERASADTAQANLVGKKARGTLAVPADLTQNDFLFQIVAQGYGGGYRNSGALLFQTIAATPSATDMQGKFYLQLAAAGSVAVTSFMTVDWTNGMTLGVALGVAYGGTGAATAAAARTNLGLAIGTNVQAWGAKLDSLSGQTWAADQITYQTAASTVSTTPLTSFARTFLDDTTAAAVLTTIGAQPLDATLTALAAYNTNGILVQTAADTFAGRTLTGTANQVDVANGTGVSGNPTLTVSSTLICPGTLDVGTFSLTGATAGLSVQSSGLIRTSKAVTTAVDHVAFYNPNGLVGHISTSASVTSYTTSSDGRLKTDLRSFDSGPIIDALEVWNFQWTKTGDRGYGLIAQEAVHHWSQGIVLGGSDVETEPWGIDYGQLTPLLLQEVKNLRARVAELEARPQPN